MRLQLPLVTSEYEQDQNAESVRLREPAPKYLNECDPDALQHLPKLLPPVSPKRITGSVITKV
ncbi:MAG: hypothetical protein JWQ71_2872 [Pedosphaera sp.]|nr:hypothetical protein [Pedosphaera sp.]